MPSQEQPKQTSSGAAGGLVNKVKDIAVKDAKAAESLAAHAIKSGSYLYPFRGIYYFLRHPELSGPLRRKLLPVLGTAFGVTSFMFLVTYVPQAAVLALVNGPLAIFTTIFLVLSESSTITNLISRQYIMDNSILDTFDGTLILREQADLVAKGRVVKPKTYASNALDRMGKLVKPHFSFSSTELLRSCLYLALNFIPVVGPFIYLMTRARSFGHRVHTRYFELKGMTNKEQDQWKSSHQAEYFGFAIPALLLEMVPIAGIFFTFTNTVGAAVWASDIEKSKSKTSSNTVAMSEIASASASGQETGTIPAPGEDEQPPSYRDEI